MKVIGYIALKGFRLVTILELCMCMKLSLTVQDVSEHDA
jgi:hypothetical protein